MLSFQYYERIFERNSTKLAEIKRLIVADFKKMEQAFFEADSEKNLIAMKGELHKMNPIVRNLRDEEFSLLMEKYKVISEYDDSIQSLHLELKDRLANVYAFLE